MRKALILLACSFLAAGIARNSYAEDTAPAHPTEPAATAAGQPASAAAPAATAPAAAPTKVAEATTAQGAKPANATTEAAADDPVICRTEYETGSRVRKNKICMTKSQWDAHTQAARRFMHGIDQSRSTQPGNGNGG